MIPGIIASNLTPWLRADGAGGDRLVICHFLSFLYALRLPRGSDICGLGLMHQMVPYLPRKAGDSLGANQLSINYMLFTHMNVVYIYLCGISAE